MAEHHDGAQPAPQDPFDIGNTPSTPTKESVGYGRPPTRTRWKKGQSGNSKGRPKGSKNLSTLFDEELKQTVTITENGTRKRISKKQAIAKRVVNGAIAGETKMVPLLLGQTQANDEPKGSQAATDLPLAAEDDLVIRNIVARIRAAESLPDTPPAETPPSDAPSDGGAEAPLSGHAPHVPTE